MGNYINDLIYNRIPTYICFLFRIKKRNKIPKYEHRFNKSYDPRRSPNGAMVILWYRNVKAILEGLFGFTRRLRRPAHGTGSLDILKRSIFISNYRARAQPTFFSNAFFVRSSTLRMMVIQFSLTF